MDLKAYWATKHRKYASEDWVNRPAIFAEFAINYFPKTGRLLDLGAGQGQDSRYFAKLGYDVTSTDFSNEALEISRQKVIDQKLKLDIKVVDISKPLSFRGGSFDIVYSHLALHYFDHKTTQKLFSEIHRVLRSSGVFAALFNTIEDPEVASGEKIADELYGVEGLIKRFFSLEYLKRSTSGKFETVVMDKSGETYKDTIKTLVRFVGKRI